MADEFDVTELTHHHRVTLERVFQHPMSHNLDWHDVLSLLESVGDVEQRHDDRFHVTIGSASATLTRHSRKDLDADTLVEVRRLLHDSGLAPSPPPVEP